MNLVYKDSMIKHIELIRPINSGCYGTVYKAYDHRTKEFRAVKLLPNARPDISPGRYSLMKQNEVSNMARLHGYPNIVKLYDVLSDTENTYLVQEFCGGNTLHESMVVKSLPLIAKRKAIKDMVNAIFACHKEGIIFCDLKPSNIIFSIDAMHYKLTDFGSSVDTTSKTPLPIAMVTPLFTAPELFFEKHASFPFDIWSLGILAYMLLYDVHPFKKNDIFVPDNLLQPLVFPSYAHPTDSMFISTALKVDPTKRATIAELHDMVDAL